MDGRAPGQGKPRPGDQQQQPHDGGAVPGAPSERQAALRLDCNTHSDTHLDGLGDVVDRRGDDDGGRHEHVWHAAQAAAVRAVARVRRVEHAGAEDDVRAGLLEASAEQHVHGEDADDGPRRAGVVHKEHVLRYDHARDLQRVVSVTWWGGCARASIRGWVAWPRDVVAGNRSGHDAIDDVSAVRVCDETLSQRACVQDPLYA